MALVEASLIRTELLSFFMAELIFIIVRIWAFLLELLEEMKHFNPEDSCKDAIFHRFLTQKESKLKNYSLKIYSQHANFLNAI